MNTTFKKIKLIKKQTLIKCLTGILALNAWMVSAQDEDVMFQAFDWNVQQQPVGTTWYNVLSQNAQRMADAGFDMIWLPPCSDSAAPQGYLPRELYNFDSAYGTEQQLRNLITQFHSANMRVIGDIVINHRVGSTNAVDFMNPNWPTTFITSDDEGRNFVSFPVEFSINGDYFPGLDLKADGSNGTFAAARDLDHYNPGVRQEVKNWMNFLKNDLGYDGWRYDFVHGYDPIFNKEYNEATQPYFAVGELLESSRVQTNNWVNFTQQSSSAFDFNTKVTLQNAFRDNNLSYLRDFSGNASGMIGINPGKSVTFLENHDTGEAQQCCGPNFVFPGGETNLRKGYAYILTHPGVPMVFWSHYFDESQNFRNAIDDLIAIRKDVRIYAGTTMNIVEARNNLYAAYIDGRSGTIAMKLGNADWSPNGNGWTLRASGVDYAVWSQGGGEEIIATPFTAYAKGFTNAYTWENQQATLAQWPGANMESIGNDWYKITVPNSCSNIIFNNNGSGQTSDLEVCENAPYFSNGQFTSNPPSDFPNENNNSFTVFVKNFTSVYTWENNQATSGAWPGKSLEAIGNNWYKTEVPGTCTNIIFSNSGNGQTSDLEACENTPYFSNGQFTSNPPSDFPTTGAKFLNFSTSGSTTVYPNPFSNEIVVNFSTEKSEKITLTVVDPSGKIVSSSTKSSKTGSNSLKLENLDVLASNSLYFLKIYNEKGVISIKKILKK